MIRQNNAEPPMGVDVKKEERNSFNRESTRIYTNFLECWNSQPAMGGLRIMKKMEINYNSL
jgi:hypothetical protein